MTNDGLEVARVATSSRECLDALRAARRVVDRAEHEVEPPEDLVRRELRQAFAQRRDECPARLIEVVGDELRQQRGVFGRERGAQP